MVLPLYGARRAQRRRARRITGKCSGSAYLKGCGLQSWGRKNKIWGRGVVPGVARGCRWYLAHCGICALVRKNQELFVRALAVESSPAAIYGKNPRVKEGFTRSGGPCPRFHCCRVVQTAPKVKWLSFHCCCNCRARRRSAGARVGAWARMFF